jgi:5-methyltetrahydrofolate--homocysteine methyltransferase
VVEFLSILGGKMPTDELMGKLAELEEEETLRLIKSELEAGSDPMAILAACREGMTLVGKRYESGQYFLLELIMAAEIFRKASEILGPAFGDSGTETKGTVVFGTVRGDVHDIGKNVVIAILRAMGYQVHDLGVDVPPEKFVSRLQETGSPVLGLSGLITTAYDGMKETVNALVSAGLRKRVKVMVGGGIMNESVRAYTGADAFGRDPTEAVNLCLRFMGGN